MAQTHRAAWQRRAEFGRRLESQGRIRMHLLAPVAYDLRDHPVFRSPIKIDIKATTRIATPHTFADELKGPTVEVLPLVDNIKHFETVLKDYQAGWSTHYYEFADMPEVEVFSGGINEQTPRS